jgi:hypothetical protein
MATKFVYSSQEISEIVSKYNQGVSLENLATEYNKSVASVRMKLVKLGVYKSKASTGTTKPKLTPASERREREHQFDLAMMLVGPAPF